MTDVPRRSDSLHGLLLGGRYEIIGPLGKGGAGHVYRAIQQPLGREVALKVLRTDISVTARAEFEPRFLREAAMAGQLHHPNVVRVFDYGCESDGTRFVVMELLSGITLAQKLRNVGHLPAMEAARVGAGIARGLRHAHGKGMVHRDVKTGNIVLVPDDDGLERPLLLDFGLVKLYDGATDSDLTKVGTYMGTPAYMSPEQAKGDGVVDQRSDIYSLGCVLYRAATGKLPYMADNPLSMALKHTTQIYPEMATVVPDLQVDEELEAIIRRCMSKEPKNRYQDAGELAAALEEYAGIRLDPTTVVEAPRASKKGRWLLVLALLLLLLGVVMAVGSALGLGVVVGAVLNRDFISSTEAGPGEAGRPAPGMTSTFPTVEEPPLEEPPPVEPPPVEPPPV
ncbi:MAG: serine/threonine protein kinase, partial [Proteobacteria bacterium]|nr:serine/threonine protein kinase [Pseudomonadota bacterium]